MLEGFEENVPRKLLTLCPNVKKWVRGEPTTLSSGYTYQPVTYRYKGRFIAMSMPFAARGLNIDIKSLGGRWNPGKEGDEFSFKCWYLPNTPHSEWQLRYLIKDYVDPYLVYDTVREIESRFPLMDHQVLMTRDMVSHRGVIEAAEMGTGKTLSWIAAMEILLAEGSITEKDIWYVGPKAGVRAVGRELIKWEANFTPRMMTYNGLVKIIKEWGDDPAPKSVCFDEASCIKNHSSQRSTAARYLSNNMREEHAFDCRIIELSGTPAPKTPPDWWHLVETAEPGYVLETSVKKFKSRLCLSEQREGAYGPYPHHITWLDDTEKCATCGQYRDDDTHLFDESSLSAPCVFKSSINEVNKLFSRMKGLVRVTLKEDCLDLPPKIYVIERIKPTPQLLRIAKTIKAVSERAVTALCLLRELSDGFQYTEEVVGQVTCPECDGECQTEQAIPIGDFDPNGTQEALEYTYEERDCPLCKGKGEVDKYKRATDTISSPKDAYLIDDLELNEDVGRIIIWAGFTNSIDRLTDLVTNQGWSVLKIDGRGIFGIDSKGNPLDIDELQDAMDASHPRREELRETYDKIAVIAHPKAAGMAYTFNMARMAIYYSNVFDGEARMQSEDRIHRMGMDKNVACTIKDYILLPTDRLVLDNLKQKKKLQNLTMNRLNDAFTDGD